MNFFRNLKQEPLNAHVSVILRDPRSITSNRTVTRLKVTAANLLAVHRAAILFSGGRISSKH